MKATKLLKDQHEEVASLFEAIEAAEKDSEKEKLFLQLASNLTAHDGIEREIFYPACRDALGMNDQLGEALVEHGVIEFALYQATQSVGEEDFEFKCTVLKELVEHHVEEEEDEFFPQVEKALGNDSLELLGKEMEEAFEVARAGDFRKPLHENLRQVLSGALETEPSESKPAPAKTKPPATSKSKSRKSA